MFSSVALYSKLEKLSWLTSTSWFSRGHFISWAKYCFCVTKNGRKPGDFHLYFYFYTFSLYSFPFTGEQELTCEQDARGKVYAGHESGQKSPGMASRCDGGTMVRSARFPLSVGDHGSLGQGSVCQPGPQGTSSCQLNMSSKQPLRSERLILFLI